MSKSLTIKNVKGIMEVIRSEHPQINTILKGSIFDVDLTKDVSGVYLIYDVVNIAPNGFNGIDYTIDIFLCDNVTEINNNSNEVSVQNECSLIALDIMSIIENYNKSNYSDKDVMVSLNKNWSIQPFKERFDSLYAGAAINMNITTSYGYARCNVPRIPITPPAPATYDITYIINVNGIEQSSGTINAFEDNTLNITA